MLRVRADERPSCSALEALAATFGLVTFELLDFGMGVLPPSPPEESPQGSERFPAAELMTPAALTAPTSCRAATVAIRSVGCPRGGSRTKVIDVVQDEPADRRNRDLVARSACRAAVDVD